MVDNSIEISTSDVALLSDTIIGLQSQFNLLYDFCKDKRLQLNVRKTKVVVFENGPLLGGNENWMFDGQRQEAVNCFSYLGLSLIMQL